MPLDPVIESLFEQMPHLANYQMWRMTPDEARQEFRRLCQFANPTAPAIGKTEHAEATGPEGPIPGFDPSGSPAPRSPGSSSCRCCHPRGHRRSGRPSRRSLPGP